MKPIPLPLCALALTMIVSPLWGLPLPTAPSMSALDALSGIDFAPGRSDLDRLFGGGAAELVALADDASGAGDPGIRLRAYRSLGRFTDDPVALAGVRGAITRYRDARSGIDVLYLIATLDALAEIGDGADVASVVPLLGASDSRDLRAAAARALGGLDATAACGPLQQRTSDPQGMVRIAVNRALRRLGARCAS